MKPRHVIYVVLATLAIFAAGAVTGSVLVRKSSVTPPASPAPHGAQMWRLDQFQRVVDQMELESGQEEKIRRLIRDRQEYIADLMRLIEPDLPGVFTKLRRDILAELRPEQQHRLEEMWARLERQKKLPNRGGEFMGSPNEGGRNRQGQPFAPENRRQNIGPDGQNLGPRGNSQRPGRSPSNPPAQPSR